MKRCMAPVSLILIAFILGGCKLSSTSLAALLASPTPSQTPTPAATATPSPSPTPTNTPTPLPPARLGIGEKLLFDGDYDQALQDYQSALNEASDDETKAGALVGIGRTQYLMGNYEGALESLNQAINQYPQSKSKAQALFYRAEVNNILKNYSQAANDYAGSLQEQPGVLDAYMREAQGDALAASGDYAGAIQAYDESAKAPQISDPVYIQVKIARAYDASGDTNQAVRMYMQIYDAAGNDYLKAQMDLLAGQAYTKLGLPEQANARYQDAVNNYPSAYDSYTALVTLVNDNVTVNEESRGLVDYYAGQYGVAIDAFTRYITANPEHDGTAHYYKALALRANDQTDAAIAEFDSLIKDHAGDKFYVDAFREKAYTLWAYQDHYDYGAQTLLSFVQLYPTDANAASLLFEAARIQERGGMLSEAAKTWERVMGEYPSSEDSARSLFLAGITYYRLQNYSQAMTVFQRCLVLGTTPEEQSQAYFWIGKTAQATGNKDAAQHAWEQGSQRDPTGYYSERARNILQGKPVLATAENYDLGYDLDRERGEAQDWMRKTFNLPADTILSGLGELASDPRMQRGNMFWKLGLYTQARDEFEALRKDMINDPVNTYRLANHFLNLGLYRSAILSARQVLTLANLSDADSLNAPIFFNHIRFGLYFKDQILKSAQQNDFNPLLLFSVTRQESLFEGFAYSSAGARGLLQLMPATGDEMVRALGWPENYTVDDLERPVVNVPLGSLYLARQRDYFDGDLFAALAGYNGGPGNSQKWKELSNNDPDLFLEIIRYDETRTYLMQISDFLNIYNRLYSRKP